MEQDVSVQLFHIKWSPNSGVCGIKSQKMYSYLFYIFLIRIQLWKNVLSKWLNMSRVNPNQTNMLVMSAVYILINIKEDTFRSVPKRLKIVVAM